MEEQVCIAQLAEPIHHFCNLLGELVMVKLMLEVELVMSFKLIQLVKWVFPVVLLWGELGLNKVLE